MNSNTRKKIESVVLSNMGVTEEEFKSWKGKGVMPDIEDTEEEENADGYDYDELPDF